MANVIAHKAVVVAALLMMVVAAPAQKTQLRREALQIEGYSGDATVIRLQGRAYVDVEDLARITNGSLRSEREQIILKLDAASQADDNANQRGFSREFTRAAIEAMASLREWGGMLLITVQNGYPVGNTMAGNTIAAYQARAGDRVALAAVAASTDSDSRGLELLNHEFNNLQTWSDRFVQARISLSATNLTTSQNGLKDDEDAQKIIHCGQFLAQMFASGAFQDDASCH